MWVIKAADTAEVVKFECFAKMSSSGDGMVIRTCPTETAFKQSEVVAFCCLVEYSILEKIISFARASCYLEDLDVDAVGHKEESFRKGERETVGVISVEKGW